MNNSCKTALMFLIAAAVTFGCLTVGADDADAEEVTTADEFISAITTSSTEKVELTLTQNIEFSSSITVPNGSDVTIDLAGHNITAVQGTDEEGKSTKGRFVVDEGATLTIKDSSNGTGSVNGIYSTAISIKGTLNIEGGTFNATGSKNIQVGSKGTLNMNGGTVNSGTSSAIEVLGTANILSGYVEKIRLSEFDSYPRIIKIGSLDDAQKGPTINQLGPNYAVVHFYSGEITTLYANFLPGSTFTENGIFKNRPADSKIPIGCTLVSVQGGYYIDQVTEAEAIVKLERDGQTYYFDSIEVLYSSMTEGDVVTLLQNLDETLKIGFYNGTVDLGGFTISTSGDGSHGIDITPENKSFDVDVDVSEFSILIKNGGVHSDIPIYADSAGSNLLNIVVEDDLKTVSGDEKPDIYLGPGSYADVAAHSGFDLSGYLAEDSDGKQYACGTVSLAMDFDADRSVTLLFDRYEAITIGSSGEWTVDLNGKTIYSNGRGISLDVKNATLTVKNGKIVSEDYGAIVWDVDQTGDINSKLILEDLDIQSQAGFGVYGHGSNNGITIEIRNSSVSAPNGVGVYFPTDGTLSVIDSEITGKTGVEIRNGSLTISGDSTVVKSEESNFSVGTTPSEGGSTVTGAAVAVSPYGSTGDIEVSIAGGVFEGPVAFAQVNADGIQLPSFNFSISGGSFKSTSDQGCIVTTSESIDPFITGGTFSTDVERYCEEGVAHSQDSNGNFVVGSVKVTFIYGDQEKEVEIGRGSAVSTEDIPTDLPVAGAGYEYAWMIEGAEWDPDAGIYQNLTVTYTLFLKAPTVVISGSSTSEGYVLNVNASHEAANVELTYLWSDGTTGESITVTASGTYTVTVTASDGSLTSTGTASYTVRFSYTAPAVGAGFSVEYGDDTAIITAQSGYELTIDGGATVTDTITVGPGEVFDVRRAASSTMDASSWTRNTSDARPAAPAAPSLHVTSSTVTSTGDGILIKVGEGDWATTVTGLSAETGYTIQYRSVSNGSAFASEVGEVQVTTEALPAEEVSEDIQNPDGTTTTITTRPDGSSTTSQTEEIENGTQTTVVDTDPEGDVTQTVITETETKNDAGDTVHMKEEVTTTSEDVTTSKTNTTYTSENGATVTKVTVETVADDIIQAVSQTTVSAPSGGSVDQSTIDAAVTQMTAATESYGSIDRTITIQAESGADAGISVSIEPEALGAIADSGAALEISGGIGSVTAPTEVAESLSGKTDGLTFSMVEADKEQMHPVQQEAVGDRPTYQMVITSGEDEFHELGGTVTVSIPYDLGPGETAETLIVYYVDDEGNREAKATSYDEENQVVSFVTDHFSYYVIGAPAEESPTVPVTFGFDPETAVAQIYDASGTLIGTAGDDTTLNLAPGNFTVVVSADGYVTVTETLVVGEGDLGKLFFQQLSPVESGDTGPDEPVNPPHQDDDPYVPPLPPSVLYPDTVHVNLDDGGIDTTGILACAAAACAAAIFAMFAVFEYRKR